MRLPVAANTVLRMAVSSEILDVETFAQLSLVCFMEAQENRYVLFSDCKEPQDFPGPEDFIPDNVREKLLQIQYDVLCFLIKYLCDIYVPLLAASTDILLGGNLLHQRGDLIEDVLVNFWVEITEVRSAP